MPPLTADQIRRCFVNLSKSRAKALRGLKELELPQGETAGPEERARRLRGRLDGFVNRCQATA